MAKQPKKQPEFSSENGFLIPGYDRRGVNPRALQPSTYQDAARYMGGVIEDLAVSGNVDIRNLDQQIAVAAATFNDFGGAKLEGPNGMTIDPRIWAFNSSRALSSIRPDSASSNCDEWTMHGATYTCAGAGVDADGNDGDGNARLINTTAVANSDATFLPTAITSAIMQRRHQPVLVAKFKLTSVAGCRFWMSIADGNLRASDSAAAFNSVGVRFSTGASDTTFKLVTSDGAAATVTATATTVAADTLYIIELWEDSSAAYCRVNGGPVVSSSTNLSTSTTSRTNVGLELRTLAAAVKGLRCYNLTFSQM